MQFPTLLQQRFNGRFQLIFRTLHNTPSNTTHAVHRLHLLNKSLHLHNVLDLHLMKEGVDAQYTLRELLEKELLLFQGGYLSLHLTYPTDINGDILACSFFLLQLFQLIFLLLLNLGYYHFEVFVIHPVIFPFASSI